MKDEMTSCVMGSEGQAEDDGRIVASSFILHPSSFKRPLRPNALRGRRIMGWTVLLFVLAQLGVSLVLDHLWTAVKFRSLTDNLEALARQPRSPDVVCLGSSRMGSAFREDVVQALLRDASADPRLRVFNGSIEGANLVTIDYSMEKMLATGLRPRFVLIEVEPETLASNNRWHRFDIMRMLTWANLLDHVVESRRSGGFREIVMTRFLPLYYFRKQILAETGRALDIQSSKDAPAAMTQPGPAPQSAGVAWTVYMEQKRDESQPPEVRTRIGLWPFERWLQNYQIGGKPAQALERLVERCRRAGATVLLVAVPTSSTHRKLYTREVDALFLAHLQQVERRLGCKFVDYRDRVPDRFFQDSHHVLLEGGNLFSQDLTEEVLTPMWTRQKSVAGRQGF